MPSTDYEREKADFLAFYDQNVRSLEEAKNSFRSLITALIGHNDTMAVSKVDGRIKDREECIKKFNRKYRSSLEEKNEPYEIRPNLTDIIGLRVVCLYEDEIDRIAAVMRSHFDVIDVTDKVLAVESTESSFGYKGLHMDLMLNPARRALPEYMPYSNFPFELQIRTIIQDSWSVLDHKIKYKKSIPNQLKRRINVLSALFELADREFRQIRDSTEAEMKHAAEDVAAHPPQEGEAPSQAELLAADLTAFTFLKITNHFFPNYEFEPHKVDGFVQEIRGWDRGITRGRFNDMLTQSMGTVKRYKQYFEESQALNKMNPYTVIRHCLYLADRGKFSKALSKVARESIDSWLAK